MKTTDWKEIIQEAKDGGCENADQIVGYLASLVSELRKSNADTKRINTLNAIGNFAVWRGGLGTHNGNRQSVEILALDADGIATEEVLSEAETLREAIDSLGKFEKEDGE